jgi:hypothetical protein
MAYDQEIQDFGATERIETTIHVVDADISGATPVTISAEEYDEFAAKIVRRVEKLDSQTEVLGRHVFDVLEDIFKLHLVGMQNPEHHKALLARRGVKLTKRTPPELATVKAMYPKALWKERSATMDNWKRSIMAFLACKLLPAEVPQWMRNKVPDENGKELGGYKKVDAVLRALKPRPRKTENDPDETFNSLLTERLKTPVASISAVAGLESLTGCAVLLVHADRSEVRVLDKIVEVDLVRKIMLRRQR